MCGLPTPLAREKRGLNMQEKRHKTYKRNSISIYRLSGQSNVKNEYSRDPNTRGALINGDGVFLKNDKQGV